MRCSAQPAPGHGPHVCTSVPLHSLLYGAAADCAPAGALQVSLLFANVGEEDIILKDHIDRLAKAHPDRLSVYYVVDRTSSWSWKGGVGG